MVRTEIPGGQTATEEKEEFSFLNRTVAPRATKRPNRLRAWAQSLLQRVTAFLMQSQMERFHLVIGGHIYFQTLSAAVELDLFSLLSEHGSLSREQIARLL